MKNVKQQERRRRALARFTIDAVKAQTDLAYAQRKAVELAALKSALGVI